MDKKQQEAIENRPITEKFADLYVACLMPEMKPRSIIPKVKAAYLAGMKCKASLYPLTPEQCKLAVELLKLAQLMSDKRTIFSQTVKEFLSQLKPEK